MESDEGAVASALSTCRVLAEAGVKHLEEATLGAKAEFTKGLSTAKLHAMGLLMCVVCLPHSEGCFVTASLLPSAQDQSRTRGNKSSRKLDKLIPGSKKSFQDVRYGPRDLFRCFMIDYISKTQRIDAATNSLVRCDYNWAQLVRVRKALSY